MTASEFFAWVHLAENRHRFCELDCGVIVESRSPGKYHGFVCANITGILGNFASQRHKGYVCINKSGFIAGRHPDTVLGPDVTFYEEDQTFDAMERHYAERPPLLAVEVLSPNDRINKTNRRITQMFRGGVALVWLVDPESRDVSVYQLGHDPLLFLEADELTGAPVLADFRCRVAEFFAKPGA